MPSDLSNQKVHDLLLLQAPSQTASAGEHPEVDRYIFRFRLALLCCRVILTLYDMICSVDD